MPKIIYADSTNSDMLYATKAELSDPTFYMDTDDKKYIFLDRREIGVFDEHNKNQAIASILIDEPLAEAAKIGKAVSTTNKLALYLIGKYGLKDSNIEVPNSFPLDMADFLRSEGISLTVKNPFFPEREIKDTSEIEIIRDNLKKTQKAFRRIEKILSDSLIKDDYLEFEGQPLTSETLKKEAEKALLEEGMIDVVGMIISSGKDASIPHHKGKGLIKPHETIICDLFPRNRNNGYYADMTRTYLKGSAPEKVRLMYEAVRETQEKAITFVGPGKKLIDAYQLCVDTFKESGWNTGDYGFIHGLGHGLGLDIHENPRSNAVSTKNFEIGNVITMEPGLYYPELGGVRIEDVVAVTENGCDNLTDYPKNFIIP